MAAGPLYVGIGGWGGLGREAFLLNALVYGLSFCIYRFGVDPADEVVAQHAQPLRPTGPAAGPDGQLAGLPGPAARIRAVLVLAPTWIALNAALGLWTTQSIFNLVKNPTRSSPTSSSWAASTPGEISVGLGFGLVAVLHRPRVLGRSLQALPADDDHLLRRPRRSRRSSLAALVLNHSDGWTTCSACRPSPSSLGGLFVLAGATPAALGLLADTSEAHPADRGAIMGLYSVFLALGQIIGSLLGGTAAEIGGIDGILVATLILLAIALAPLSRLRAVEHRLEPLLADDTGGRRHGRPRWLHRTDAEGCHGPMTAAIIPGQQRTSTSRLAPRR